MSTEDLRLPPYAPGLRIGLFGGSFNPAHDGHRLASLTALRRLGLDRLWVMVTPGNPLKNRADLAALHRRIAATRALLDDPRIVVTAFEAEFGSPYSWRTVERLTDAHPGVRFVWVMGADNLAGFHRWQHWRRLADTVPIAVVDRPGSSMAPLGARAALALSRWRRPDETAAGLADALPPAWTFLRGPLSPLSSSDLRRRGLRL